MVVVPAFAQSEQRQPDVISTVVRRFVPASSEDMRQGINRISRVVADNGRNKESPDEQLGTGGVQAGRCALQYGTHNEQGHREQHGHGDVIAVQPAQFGEAFQISDPFGLCAIVAVRQEPSHVAPEEAVLAGRVGILRLIRMRMVMAVVGCPPQRAPLDRHGAQCRKHELRDSGRLERSVREIAMVEAGDGKHSQHIQPNTDDQCGRTPADPDNAQTREMDRDEGHDARDVNPLRVGVNGGARITIKPCADCTGHIQSGLRLGGRHFSIPHLAASAFLAAFTGS